MDSAREHRKNVKIFYSLEKNFGSGQDIKLWNSIRSVGIPKHLTVLIRDLHAE